MSEEESENVSILRAMNCELNQLSMPDGSAMLMQGRLTFDSNVIIY